jgi:hypothetical protein
MIPGIVITALILALILFYKSDWLKGCLAGADIQVATEA